MIPFKEASSLFLMPHMTDGASAQPLHHTPHFLKLATISMEPRKTKNCAKHNSPETIPHADPPADPHDDCLLFKLLTELQESIYTYIFAPGPECSSDSAVAIVAMGDRYYKRSPSGVLLRTRRLINTDAADMFVWAMRNLTLVIGLSSARKKRSNFNPVPKPENLQISRLKRLVVIRYRFRYEFDKEVLEFVEQLLPCGTAYWAQVGADPTRFAYDMGSVSPPMTSIRSLALFRARDPGVLKKIQFGRIVSDARAYRTGVPKG